MKKKEEEIKQLQLGDVLPELKNVQWIGGKPLADRKKYTAVIFWNIWDESAVSAVPEWDQLRKKHQEILSIIAVSDEKKSAIEECLKNTETDLPIGSVPNSIFIQYMEGYYMTPYVYLADSERRLMWTGHPFYLPKIMKILTEENGSQKEVNEFETLRKRFDNLRNAMTGNNSECLGSKEKYKSYAADYLKVYPEDEFVQNILHEYEVLIPNEKVPSLKKLEWLNEPAEIGRSAHLAVFPTEERDFKMMENLHKKYGEKLPIMGIVKESWSGRRKKTPIAKASDSLYNTYITKNTVKEEINSFLISASGKLLFSSAVSEMDAVLHFFTTEKNAEKKILLHFLDKEKFGTLSAELSFESELSEEQFSEIYSLGKKILELEPCCFSVLSRLMDLSCRVGVGKLKEVCEQSDVSRWTPSLIRKLVSDLDEMEDVFYPAEFLLKWAEKAVQIEPENALNSLSLFKVLLRTGRKKDARSAMDRALELDPTLKPEFEKIKKLSQKKE